MASGNAILAGILGGLGGAGQAIGGGFAQAQKDQLEREKLAQERDLRQQIIDAQASQFETTQKGLSTPAETLFGYIGMPLPPGMDPKQPIPNTLGDNFIKMAQEQQKVAREQDLQTKTAAFLRGAQGRPGQPAELMGQLAEGEDPEAAALIPRSANVPAIPRMGDEDLAAGLFARGNKMSDVAALLKVIRETEGDAWAPLGENAPGLYNKRTAATQMFPDRPVGPAPEARPGYEVMTSWDKNQRPTYREERISSGVELDGEARARGYGSYAQAPESAQMEIKRYSDARALRGQQQQGVDAARLNAKPLTEEDARLTGAQTANLAAVKQVQGFSADEIGKYVGLLNQPIAKGRQMAAGAGVGTADPRFAEFQTAIGRLKAAMFDTGGKALTPMEASITSAFNITGDEPNAVTFMQKVRSFDAYTRVSRDLRIDMSRTGRGQIDPAEYDRRLADGLRAAGVTVPTQAHPSWNPQSPQGGAGGGSGWSIQRVR